jgi:hypothetical protein
MFGYDTFVDLGRNIHEWNHGQQQRVIKYLAQKKLSELRNQQHINRLQQNSDSAKRYPDAMLSLQAYEDILRQAVDFKEF